MPELAARMPCAVVEPAWVTRSSGPNSSVSEPERNANASVFFAHDPSIITKPPLFCLFCLPPETSHLTAGLWRPWQKGRRLRVCRYFFLLPFAPLRFVCILAPRLDYLFYFIFPPEGRPVRNRKPLVVSMTCQHLVDACTLEAAGCR